MQSVTRKKICFMASCIESKVICSFLWSSKNNIAQQLQAFDKTYFYFLSLQWLGDDKLRRILEGKLVLIHLVCKKESNRSNVSTSSFPGSTLSKDTSAPKRQIFRPCLALRIAGSPGNELWYYVFRWTYLRNNIEIISQTIKR